MSHTEHANYPRDLTDDQRKLLSELLPRPSRPGAPQTVCRRAVIDAILHVPRSGCAWRLLPREFPRWKTVYGLFREWRNSGVRRKAHDSLRDMLRRRAGRKTSPSAAIIDGHTVKTTEVDGARGYDGAREVNGRKRHVIVDTLGLVPAVVVHPANVHDYDGAVSVLKLLGRMRTRLHRL